MPTRPAKPCRWPGCPALTHERFCPEHQRDEYHRQDANRPGTKERGYAGGWFVLRQEILRRDQHVCRACGGHATDVDHIVPKRAGGTDDPKNLQALCHACHSAKTMRESVNPRTAMG
ncbi:MAG: HNH endonuclease [Acidobacteriia bacterium]|nr:HNH endonuclease [Terriglobia bacterium]